MEHPEINAFQKKNNIRRRILAAKNPGPGFQAQVDHNMLSGIH